MQITQHFGTIWYHFGTSVFKSEKLVKLTKSYIERNFTSVTCTEKFLYQNFHFFSRIISSSGLNITSELEGFKAVDKWMSYNIRDRQIYTRKLMSYLRLDFLTDSELLFCFP